MLVDNVALVSLNLIKALLLYLPNAINRKFRSCNVDSIVLFTPCLHALAQINTPLLIEHVSVELFLAGQKHQLILLVEHKQMLAHESRTLDFIGAYIATDKSHLGIIAVKGYELVAVIQNQELALLAEI